MVILDTDLITLLERADNPVGARIRVRLRQLDPDEISTTVITYEEQMSGWLGYLSRARGVAGEVEAYRRLSRHIEHYNSLKVHPFDELAAVEFQRLKQLRVRIGTMDLKIAAIVISQKATLLSRNLRDFSQVAELDVANWSA